jgi:hypothetical protein
MQLSYKKSGESKEVSQKSSNFVLFMFNFKRDTNIERINFNKTSTSENVFVLYLI